MNGALTYISLSVESYGPYSIDIFKMRLLRFKSNSIAENSGKTIKSIPQRITLNAWRISKCVESVSSFDLKSIN
ncbi:hypothetical protein QR98_0038200 [Sarcoptes scabiei]|uniref:Uncharacterized protein n=1 Tax=Sarcoptes scabiei TaxID=52283 RepID=A0A132A2V4_SARSC|nr:hypothetical protein QR98_0038200 [Sarcoptes scabiei]